MWYRSKQKLKRLGDNRLAKKVYGKCCICGLEKELTFEHIPPRAAFNSFGLKLYDFWGFLLEGNKRYTQAQQGFGGYTLCASCNNLTGEWYGTAYAEFASQGKRYYKSNAQGLLRVPYEISPLRVFKQVVSCFASVNGAQWCDQNPDIRDFLLDPNSRSFPSKMDIRMYMQTHGRAKADGIKGQIDVFTGERFIGSEFAFFPFSFICVDDRTNSNYRVLNELFSLRSFLDYRYDSRAKVYLNIPRKPCNPTTLDFREGIPDIETATKIENVDREKN